MWNYFPISCRKAQTYCNVDLQLMTSCTLYAPFNVNKSIFHLKRGSRIFLGSSNKSNISTLPFNLVNFQIRDINIFDEVLWNLLKFEV